MHREEMHVRDALEKDRPEKMGLRKGGLEKKWI
jgi:hypothetical protein